MMPELTRSMEDKALFKSQLQRKCKVALATGGRLASLADMIDRWLTDSYADNEKKITIHRPNYKHTGITPSNFDVVVL